MLAFPSETDIEVGVDEAGRGCLYGPVVAAAVVLSREYYPEYELIRDSKKIPQAAREKLAEFIYKNAQSVGVGVASVAEIDQINILQATYLAMHRALEQVACDVECTLIRVDGNRFSAFRDIRHECVIKGDDKYLTIAAASIIAKTYRDKLITDEATNSPDLQKYGLAKNKGYGTAEHIAAINKYGKRDGGACLGHRMTFNCPGAAAATHPE